MYSVHIRWDLALLSKCTSLFVYCMHMCDFYVHFSHAPSSVSLSPLSLSLSLSLSLTLSPSPPVREKAKQLVALLKDDKKLKEERQRAHQVREEMREEGGRKRGREQGKGSKEAKEREGGKGGGGCVGR